MAASMDEGVSRLIDITNKLEIKCRDISKDQDGDEYLRKCCDRLVVLQKKDLTDQNKGKLREYIHELTQAILDFTFSLENKLVDEDFPETSSNERIADLIRTLSEPEKLVAEIWGSNEQVVHVLGEDLYECLSWRRGALFYMYCCTVQEDRQRVTRCSQYFSESIVQGVQYLQKMLSVRRPLSESRDNIIAADEETYNLLSKGIFSDTHMLALMYAGEMCYWWQLYISTEPPDGSTVQWPFRETGQRMLSIFINAVNGPLRGKGWTSERAEELIKALK